jgi:oxidase EvaA
MGAESRERMFLRSALTAENRFHSAAATREWIGSRANASPFCVERVPLDSIDGWSFEEHTGNLVHRSGKFFRVEGLSVQTNVGPNFHWDQPIIDQPEIGILGIVAKRFDGVLYFLMQAKMEPGNIDPVQITPTVQATRSNYTQVHQGARPHYVEYFLEPERGRMLVDQLQYEQASAFLGKRNRNMVVLVEGDVEVRDDFRWLTLGQVKQLLRQPNLVSMDARTVLSCIPLVDHTAGRDPELGIPPDAIQQLDSFQQGLLRSMGSAAPALHADDDIVGWLAGLRTRCELSVQRIPLASLSCWTRSELEISHDGGRYFEVVGVRVAATNREVRSWEQPLVKSTEKGLAAFLVKRINDVPHFLVQAKVEPGNPDIVALGPTVQCALGVERVADRATWPPFMDVVLNAPADNVRFGCVQSEEGGRFYHVENDYRIVELNPEGDHDVPDDYMWLTLRQVNQLLRYGHVNIEARTLLSCLSFL